MQLVVGVNGAYLLFWISWGWIGGCLQCHEGPTLIFVRRPGAVTGIHGAASASRTLAVSAWRTLAATAGADVAPRSAPAFDEGERAQVGHKVREMNVEGFYPIRVACRHWPQVDSGYAGQSPNGQRIDRMAGRQSLSWVGLWPAPRSSRCAGSIACGSVDEDDMRRALLMTSDLDSDV